MQTLNILRVDASARKTGSTTREVVDAIIENAQVDGQTSVVRRDVGEGLPFVTEAWIGANFTPEEDRTAEQQDTLALSDSLIEEIEAADVLVIGVPIYNFGVPASLKSWVDLIARARKTFRYTENGPEGLMKGKRAVLVVASGGTKVDSEIDFATPYMRQAMKFIGIDDIEVVQADQQMAVGEQAKSDALAEAQTVGKALNPSSVKAA